MSNIAPHSRYKFDKNKHILRQDIIFAEPGAHVSLKWTKTLQESSAHHFVQLPTLSNSVVCPVLALKKPIAPRPLPPYFPLFAHPHPPYHPVVDTTIRDALKRVLDHICIPQTGHGFHTFRRSGATLAYDNNVQLQHYGPLPLEKFSCMDLPPECFFSSFNHSCYFAAVIPHKL